MPEVNVELLEKVMHHILDHPEEHDQTMWFRKNTCGTAACFAGHVALLSGYQPGSWQLGWDGTTISSCAVGEGGTDEVPDLAQDLLCLTKDQANMLFYGENTVPELQVMVKDLVDGNPITPGQEWLDYHGEDDGSD